MFLLLIGNAQAQVAECSVRQSNTTFSSCIRNGIVDTAGQLIPRNTDIKQACNAVISSATYYQCLCERYDVAVACYQSFCASDQRLPQFIAGSNEYCAKADNVTVTSGAPLPPITFVPGATVVPGAQPTKVAGSGVSPPTPATFNPSNDATETQFSWISFIIYTLF